MDADDLVPAAVAAMSIGMCIAGCGTTISSTGLSTPLFCEGCKDAGHHIGRYEQALVQRDAALAALRLAEPALRTLRDGHCDCTDCAYTKALNAIVAVLKETK